MHGFVDTRVGGDGGEGRQRNERTSGGEGQRSDRARGESDHLYLAWVRVVCIRHPDNPIAAAVLKTKTGFGV
jgi:hypothetical protein